ncbi:hypothetical protein FKM82_015673 [Ascaphus truei]
MHVIPPASRWRWSDNHWPAAPIEVVTVNSDVTGKGGVSSQAGASVYLLARPCFESLCVGAVTSPGIMEDRSGFRPSAGNLDDPPNSRVFLVVSKSVSEDAIRDRFSEYGDIQDIWVVKDKHTKESKGIAFVKYAKSSQACRALEEMHGRCLSDSTKPIKVFIAQSRGSSSHRDVEDEELTRIFVVIPKSYSEEDIKDKFKEYGQIEYCSIIKNKATGESKGLGYVRYLKPSQAAIAIENCDRRFKAILAEPRNKAINAAEPDYHGSSRRDMMAPEHTPAMYLYEQFDYSAYDKSGEAVSKRLIVVSRLPLVQEQMYSLFNLVSGLEYCEVQPDLYMSYGVAVIQYQNIAGVPFMPNISCMDLSTHLEIGLVSLS